MLSELQAACAKGDCVNLGYVHAQGLGVSINPEAAARFYKKACDAKRFMGCSNLGVFYEDGTGVAQDLKAANQLYKKACDGGDAAGCPLPGDEPRRRKRPEGRPGASKGALREGVRAGPREGVRGAGEERQEVRRALANREQGNREPENRSRYQRGAQRLTTNFRLPAPCYLLSSSLRSRAHHGSGCFTKKSHIASVATMSLVV